MRYVKKYTVKEWNKFNLVMQEKLCQRYHVILTNHKTKRELGIAILKGFNQKNFDKGMKMFDGIMKQFNDSISAFTKELGHDEEYTPKKNHVKIWSDKKDVKIWGNKKRIF